MDDLEARFDSWCAARARALALFRAGRARRLDLARIRDEHADVLDGAALARVRKEAEAARYDRERRAATATALGLAEAGFVARTDATEQELLEREADQRARVGAAEHAVFALEAARGGVADATQRAEVDAALERASLELDPLREELFVRRAEARAELGFEDARAWARAEQPDLDPDAVLAQADRLLEATESPYRDALGRELARIGVAPGAARRGDLERALRLVRYDAFLSPAHVRAALDGTTEGLRYRLSDLPDVEVDTASRARKHPAPSSTGVRVPGEIYVSLSPRGGLADLEALLGLAGRAASLAFTSAKLPVAQRRRVDPALAELWRALLCELVYDSAWIEGGPVAARAAELAQDAPLRALASVRVLAARVRFEYALAGRAPGESPRPYRDLFADEVSRATGCAFGSAGWLDGADPPFHAAAELLGRALAARLAEHLRTRFERRFWKSRRCGDLLRELQETGGSYTAREVASELGIGPVTADSLLGERGWYLRPG